MKTKRFCKSTVSLLLVVMMLMSIVTMGIVNVGAAQTDVVETGATVSGGSRLFFKPLDWWKNDNAKYAAYFWNNSGNAWSAYATLFDITSGIYEVIVPSGSWTGLKFVRNNPTDTSPSFTDWGSTGNLTYDGSNELYEYNPNGTQKWYNYDTKSIYVGVVSTWTTAPSVHWWNSTNNGDATLTSTNSTGQYSVGSSYWSGNAQTFNIYTAQVPTNATGYKGNAGGNYCNENCTITDGNILLIFDYSNANHNVTVAYNSSGSGGGGDDGGDTGTTETYYFALPTYMTSPYVTYKEGSSAEKTVNITADTEIVEDNKNFTIDGETKGCVVYAVKLSLAATQAKLSATKGSLLSTSYYTLDSKKVIVLWEHGNIAHYVQEAYTPPTGGGGGGDVSGDTSDDVASIDGPTKLVFVGVVSHVKFVPTVTYSGGGVTSTTVTPVSIGDTYETALGASYWENKVQTFTVYSVEIPYAATNIKLENCSTTANYADNKIYLYWEYGNTYHWTSKDYTAPEGLIEPAHETTKEIYFVDRSSDNFFDDEDAKLFAVDSNNNVVEMVQTIDTKTGRNMWKAKFENELPTTEKFTFYRTSVFATEKNLLDGSAVDKNWWKKEIATARGTNIYYVYGNNSTSAWSNIKYTEPSNINNFTYGIWVDTKGNGKMEDAVKWHKVKNSDNSIEYHLYLPSHTNTSALAVYSSYNKAVISGGYYSTPQVLAKNTRNTLKLKTGVTDYKITIGSNTYDFKIYKSDNAATMLMSTTRNLYTGVIVDTLKKQNAWPADNDLHSNEDARASAYKEAIKTGGTYSFYDENGNLVNTDTSLKSIKGRGNSTFKGSVEKYGKYAYNINLDSKATLIDDATASKKWCLLANNVDHTMMRNTFAYNLANDIGLKFAPKTRLVDLYDNGRYLGAYILTEKVEYGDDTLMSDNGNIKNLDKANEKFCKEAGTVVPEDSATLTNQEYTALNGEKYTYQCKDFNGVKEFEQYNFLLEFELYNRYTNEISWFKSDRTGQAVVVKYPEFANAEQMEWIIEQYSAVEKMIYDNEAASLDSLSSLIDVDSFAKMYLIQELSLNLDAGATSYYIHNQFTNDARTKSVLYASPVWDYDWGFGSYCQRNKFVIDSNGQTQTMDASLDNFNQIFVGKKAVRTDSAQNTYEDARNFQAQLATNTNFNERCKVVYTNFLLPALDKYIYNVDSADISNDSTSGYTSNDKMLAEWLPKYRASLAMNEARWGVVNGSADGWGTKVTSNYGSFTATTGKQFNFGYDYAGTATKSYDNTVYYLNDWIASRCRYMSTTGGFYLQDQYYEFDGDVTFTATTSGTNNEYVSIMPAVTIKDGSGNAIAENQITIEVYVKGVLVATKTLDKKPVDVTLSSGTSDVYIKAYPTALPELSKTSDTEKFIVTEIGSDVDVDIYFKASDSFRYCPMVAVGDGDFIEMERYNGAIGVNATGSQKYYWFKATVPAVYGESLTLTFKNRILMNASITIDAVTISADKPYRFSVDNQNNGKEVVDLTNASNAVQNFVQSSVHMCANDTEAAELATTCLNGVIYTLGDTDSDGELSILDVTTLQLALAKKVELDDTASQLADFNLDENVSVIDATAMQYALAK